jgi:hypothetical protein
MVNVLFLLLFFKYVFSLCREPSCQVAVPEENLKVIETGAGLKIKARCSKNHHTTWQSADVFNNVSDKKILLTNLPY